MWAALGVALGLFTSAARAADPPPEAPSEAPAAAAPDAARPPEAPPAAPVAPVAPAARRALPPVDFPWWRVPPGPPPPPRTDPLLHSGIVLTSLGAAGLIASTVMVATAKKAPGPVSSCDPCSMLCSPVPGVPQCGPQLPQTPLQRSAGSGLFGASLVTFLIGLPVAAIGSIEESPELGPRESDGMLLLGVGITALSAAASAGGALSGLAKTQEEGFDEGPIASLLGAAGMLIGVPIWAAGLKRRPPSDEEGFRLVRRSRRMMISGITLTLLGSAIVGGGAIIESFGGSGVGRRAFGGTLTFAGLGMVLAGVPMWYVGGEQILVPKTPIASLSAPGVYSVPALSEEGRAGAEEPSRPPPVRAARFPEVQVGPTSMALRWSF
jgi:hypothetical protein